MNKLITAGTAIVVFGLGASGFLGFKIYQKGNEAQALINQSVTQLQSMGIHARYDLNKGLLSSTGKYYIEDFSTVDFNVSHGLELIGGKPIKVTAQLRFSDEFKNRIKSDEKRMKDIAFINNGSFLDTNLMNITAELKDKVADINMDLVPIEIKEEKPALKMPIELEMNAPTPSPNSVPQVGESNQIATPKQDNQMMKKEHVSINGANIKIHFDGNTGVTNMVGKIADINWSSGVGELKPMISLKNVGFKKDFVPGSILFGKAEFSADEYKVQNMVMHNIMNTYDFSKQQDGTYSIKNSMDVPHMTMEPIEPKGSMSMATSFNKLKAESVEGLISLFGDIQNATKEMKKVDAEPDPAKKAAAKAELETKTTELIKEKTKKHLTDMFLAGFEFSIDKLQATSTNSGNLNMVFKVGVAPSQSLEEFTVPSKVTVQAAFALKGGQMVQMLPMFVPPESGIKMEKPDELNMTFVYHQGTVYINNQPKPEMSNMINGLLDKSKSSINLIAGGKKEEIVAPTENSQVEVPEFKAPPPDQEIKPVR